MTRDIDLRFLARQNDRILAELTDMRGSIVLVSHDNARMRDDMNVLTAMVIRLEHAQQRTYDEVRSVYAQLQRLTSPSQRQTTSSPRDPLGRKERFASRQTFPFCSR